jgi:hypothetical protein
MTTSPFHDDSRNAAIGAGYPDLPIIALSTATTASKNAAELLPVAKEALPKIIDGLTKEPAHKTVTKATPLKAAPAAVIKFTGKTTQEAQEKMEKYFLANKWSDGLPMVPPTPEAVNEMLKGTDLPREHVVGTIDPKHGIATVEKIAINAVMAGARPAYMPVIIAIVEAFADTGFDLYGVQVTTGLNAPLVIVSGPIIDDLNINYSFSTIGPGWRANSTIGRVSRLMLVNLGQAWPGVNDMKDLGNPAKFGIVMAENDRQTPPGWGTMREREGFSKQTSTVSVYAAQSFRQIHDSQKYLASSKKPERIVDPMVARLMSNSLNSTAEQWGEEIVIAFSPTMAENLKRFGYDPAKIQKELYEKGRIERGLFGPRPLGSFAVTSGIPKWIDDLPDNALVPVVPTPEDIKIMVAGGKGGGVSYIIDRWGFGNSRYLTKEIKLPKNWKSLLNDLQGWETPITVK